MDLQNYKERKKNRNVKLEKRGNKVYLLTAELDPVKNEKIYKEKSIRPQQVRAMKDAAAATAQSNISNTEAAIAEMQDQIEEIKKTSELEQAEFDALLSDLEAL